MEKFKIIKEEWDKQENLTDILNKQYNIYDFINQLVEFELPKFDLNYNLNLVEFKLSEFDLNYKAKKEDCEKPV